MTGTISGETGRRSGQRRGRDRNRGRNLWYGTGWLDFEGRGTLALASCGIDLGTTNSLVAVIEEGKPKLIPNALGQVLTPSCVGIDDTGAVLVGQAAKERLITHPGLTAASFKRLMGSQQVTPLGKMMSYRPEELSQFVLRALKEDAEAYLKEAVSDVVISVPAYFNDHQRKATIDAGRLAGLRVERLVNEPTAAALAYGLGEAAEGKYLIFDLGGGTFDVSILDKYEGIMEIRATTGDSGLGGDDFTAAVERMIAARGKLELKRLDLVDQARIRRAAEQLKINLSAAHEAPFALLIGKSKYEGSITREAFETECSDLLRRLRAPTERAIVDARLKPDSFDAVVLVGGATRLPMVRSLVARMFGRLPLVSIDPDTTVALGAAVQAGLVHRDGALKDVVMTDVCPFTLGVVATDASNPKQMTNFVRAIIERNAVVPISRKMRLCTLEDNQTNLPVMVFQGENLRPEANIHLGTIPLTVQPKPKGEECVDIQFTYDINGALEVEVEVVSTAVRDRKIFRNTTGLSEEELDQRFKALAAIKLHPREHIESKTLIARAERLYAEQTPQNREVIRRWINHFEAVIADQQLRDPSPARKSFSDQLDAMENSPFRDFEG
jgi:molecular chaperone HscC